MGEPPALDRDAGMILLTLRDLRHRAVRFVVVILLGAVVFALLFVMSGLVEQFNREPFDTVDAFGAAAWVLPEGINGPFTAAGTLPADSAAAFGAGAAPVVITRSSLQRDGGAEEIVLVGHLPDALGQPPTVDGRAASAAGEVVVDETVDADVGDEIAIAGRPLTVVGRSRSTTVLAGIPLAFVNLADAQDLSFGNRDVISAVLAADAEPPAVPGTVVKTPDEIGTDTLGPLENAVSSIDLVRFLLWLVAAVIIGAVVYLSALERQRDFAVLKAIGVSNRSLVAGLALQAVLVAIAAVAVAMLLQALLAPQFPLPVSVPGRAFVQVPLVAIAISLLAGAAGMRKVARSDPALAFAGAGG